jgi:exopolysaccharide biosynthesis protein
LRVGLIGLALSLCAALAAAPPAAATIVADYSQLGSEAVIGGVTHEWGSTQTDVATQSVNVVHVAHDAPDVHFELGLPFGQVNARQTTTDQAIAVAAPRHRVVAAVNGDFWQTSALGTYAPASLNIRDGELIAGKTNAERGAFGIRADGTTVVSPPQLSVTLTLPSGGTLAANGVNTVRGADELVVYTPRFGATTGTDANGVEVRLVGATLPLTAAGSFSGASEEVSSGVGSMSIGPADLVLSATGAPGAALAALAPGDSVRLDIAIDAPWQDVVTAVGGVLLFDGAYVPDFTDQKDQVANPRTAVGVTAGGDFLLVTVDGRSETSGGMPLTDLVELMRRLGAVAAVDLDGGGSTTVVVDPAGEAPLAVANSPSDGHERRVNTTLQVVSSAVGPPVVSAPRAQIVQGDATGRRDAAVALSWTPSAPEAVVTTEVQRLDAFGVWTPVALADPRQTSVAQRFSFGKTYQFRVRVIDATGAASDWALSPRYVLRRFNEGAKQVSRQGNWELVRRGSAIGRRLAHNAFDGTSSISLNFSGLQVALVAPTGPTSAIASVTLAGVATNVDLYSARKQARMVVIVQTAVPAPGVVPAAGSLLIANAGGAGRPYVDVDAFLVLTTK